MNFYHYEKTLLKVYPLIGKLTKDIDKLVLNSALKSCNFVGSCEKVGEYIIELTAKKAELFDLKYKIDAALQKMSEKGRRLIRFGFFGCRDDELEEEKTKRAYFYRKQTAIKHFSMRIRELGIDEEEFERLKEKFNFIAIIYDSLGATQLKHNVYESKARLIPKSARAAKAVKAVSAVSGVDVLSAV